MADSAIDWLNWYEQSFARDAAPLMQLAAEKRRRQEQIDAERRQQAFTLQRDQSQSALVMAREQEMERIRQDAESTRQKSANAMLIGRMRIEHDMMSAEDKEKERRKMVEKANEYGADLPSSTSFDTASKAFIQSHGDRYVSLNKRAGQAVQAILKNSGTDPRAFQQRIANEIADDPGVAKILTVDEREQIRNNPDKLASIRSKLSKTPKKYEAFTQAAKSATDLVTAAMEKENASKPELAVATSTLRDVHTALDEERKRGGLSPGVEDAALTAYQQAAYPPQPAPAVRPRPPLPGVVPGQPQASTGSMAPSVPPPESATPGGFITRGVTDAARAVQTKGPGFINSLIYPTANNALGAPAAAPSPFAPMDSQPIMSGQPVAPDFLAKLRLQQFLQQQAATNNTLFPTAFPTNDVLAPSTP